MFKRTRMCAFVLQKILTLFKKVTIICMKIFLGGKFMKKLFSVAFGIALVLGLAACTNAQGGAKYSEDILANSEQTYHAAGAWGDWEAKESNKMEATSVAEVAKLDKGAADLLTKKNVNYLYKIGGLEIGQKNGGETVKFKKDGKIWTANSSYTIKCIRANYEEEDQKFTADQWIPDPHTAQAEALNGNVFFPTYQEAADEDGFEWSQNPVVTGGAGTYTLIVAEYKGVTTGPGYGFALVRTEAKESEYEYAEYVEPTGDYVVEKVGLIGKYGTHNWDNDELFTAGANNTYTLNGVELAANDEIKVRLNESWDKAFGAEALDAASASFSSATSGNMVVAAAGTYNFQIVLTISGQDVSAVITVTAA